MHDFDDEDAESAPDIFIDTDQLEIMYIPPLEEFPGQIIITMPDVPDDMTSETYLSLDEVMHKAVKSYILERNIMWFSNMNPVTSLGIALVGALALQFPFVSKVLGLSVTVLALLTTAFRGDIQEARFWPFN